MEWLVENHLADQAWREIFFLVAGLMRGRAGADNLLEAIEKQISGYINTLELQDLIQWANKVTANSENKYKPETKRAGAIFIALYLAFTLDRYTNLALTFARALVLIAVLENSLALKLDSLTFGLERNLEPTLELYRNLERAQSIQNSQIFTYFQYSVLLENLIELQQKIEAENVTPISKEEVVETLFEYWASAFQFDLKQLANLEEKKRKEIENYFYACELMVRCKEAAVRVSPEVWQGIEERLLTIPKND